MALLDKIEYEKRIRMVQEWIIEDWPEADIRSNIMRSWKVGDRMARNYVSEARKRWASESQSEVDEKRKLRIQSLKKLKRSLKEQYKGSPAGIFAILAVDKEIIKLEGIDPAIKIEHSGKGGGPIQQETTHRVIFEDYGE
jgi:hypothetical protein